jgi:hypothetical protein
MDLRTNQFPSIFYPVVTISNFVKICPAGLELKHAEVQTHRNDSIICVYVIHSVKGMHKK